MKSEKKKNVDEVAQKIVAAVTTEDTSKKSQKAIDKVSLKLAEKIGKIKRKEAKAKEKEEKELLKKAKKAADKAKKAAGKKTKKADKGAKPVKAPAPDTTA